MNNDQPRQDFEDAAAGYEGPGPHHPPESSIGAGALGFWKALDGIFPKTRRQRCPVHKTVNVLNKLPKQPRNAKYDLHQIWMAANHKREGEALDTFEAKYPAAVTCRGPVCPTATLTNVWSRRRTADVSWGSSVRGAAVGDGGLYGFEVLLSLAEPLGLTPLFVPLSGAGVNITHEVALIQVRGIASERTNPPLCVLPLGLQGFAGHFGRERRRL